jgi:hypothetical protein
MWDVGPLRCEVYSAHAGIRQNYRLTRRALRARILSSRIIYVWLGPEHAIKKELQVQACYSFPDWEAREWAAGTSVFLGFDLTCCMICT